MRWYQHHRFMIACLLEELRVCWGELSGVWRRAWSASLEIVYYGVRASAIAWRFRREAWLKWL